VCHHTFCLEAQLNVSQLFRKLEKSLETISKFLPEFSSPYSTPFTDTAPVRKPAAANPFAVPYQGVATASIPLKEPTYNEIHAPTLRADRPALLVSSTSWTADEEFGILLEALKLYEVRATEQNSELPEDAKGRLPKLLVVVTGKGPERKEYMSTINELQASWKWTRCISLWLEASDYPVLLGKYVAYCSERCLPLG
jgi:beta-1,4-mannosyltransferase